MGKVPSVDQPGRIVTKRVLTLLIALLTSAPAMSANFEPEWGRHGMVVTSVRPAAAAGQQVLENGGNAVDAAIATAFAAAVAHPFSSGLGGGLFALVHDARDGKTRSLDARETAPASATAEFYAKNPQSIREGARSVGVPGFVQGVYALHQKYGSGSWKDLIEPAIKLAEQGVEVSIWHRSMVSHAVVRLEDYPETRRIQTIDGLAPPLGWKLVQADLAKTLRLVQENGEKALAVGAIASKIEQATGGAVTELDLARYEVKWREPVRGSYRGYDIFSMPPPSSGGVLLVQMLNVLERFDLAALGKDSSEYIHLLAGVMKLAFADRAAYLGDIDFYPVPVERLISAGYAGQQAARLNPEGQPRVGVEFKQLPDDAGTTQISVMDRYGNAIALSQSINTIFGSKITVPGTGIILNNHMDDFSIGPELPNAWEAVGSIANSVAPGKRPLSSMTPTVVLQDGRAVMVVGSAMGTRIITAVLHSLINTIDFGFDPQRAVNAPRFHHQWKPDRLSLEPEFPLDVRRRLEALGYELQERSIMGAAQLILFDRESCIFWGGADGRRDSGSAGVNIGEVPVPSAEVVCQGAVRNRAVPIH
ncbi:MAG: gamma-glutamyltransferase [Proteobacteria bacterium]|nr:gamma-glutamyltransferase [Pseudomonadota bacterium]